MAERWERLPEWPKLLRAYADANGTRPFAWGEHDCALFALGGVDAMCGTDLAAPFRGAYSDVESAVAFCQGQGWATLQGAVEAFEGERLRGPLYAQRGDVIFVPPWGAAAKRPEDFNLDDTEHRHFPILGGLALVVDGSGWVPLERGMARLTLRLLQRAGGIAYGMARRGRNA